MSSQKTQNQRRKCNVIHHTKTRSEWRIINQIKDESKNMVEICEDCYIKENDFLPRHATLCSIMQLSADKEAAIVIQILNSIAHFCLVAFKPLWHHWIPNIDRMFACRSRCMDCSRRGETAMNMISLKNLWSNAKERNHSNVRLQT